ncbi:carbohydrate-binding protein [Streptomyces sp. NK08204]|uniref:carbohydrate-binding protein n=1 Tax=Streptomyces sp. NK08204 TaxID=2873260 RepID=UPI001CEC88B5|nr:carbohydrate-binding protein [Streptomyces sp. NK08204]
MTPGDNGPSTPEDDDPFGYLYADGQARGAQPPSGGYGYPNSVSRVRAVGERQYGQQQAAPYGQSSVPTQGAYGQPNAYYQAPETLPGGAPPGSRPAPPVPARRGPNTKGLLIGAIAVVAAVVIGIGAAMISGDSGDKTGNDANANPAQSQAVSPTPSSSASAAPGELPKADAQALQLAGGATKASDVTGAKAAGGVYVGGLNTVGSSVTWTINDLPEAGPYTLFMQYSVAGENQSMTVTVNGKEFGSKVNFKNYRSAADGDFANGWTHSFVWPTLQKGSNTISISCQAGDKCNVLLDQVYLKKGQVTG